MSSTDCPSCPAENTRDYPMCRTCETKRHFTNRKDCRCVTCQAKRAEAMRLEYARLAAIAWDKELQYVYGRSFAAA